MTNGDKLLARLEKLRNEWAWERQQATQESPCNHDIINCATRIEAQLTDITVMLAEPVTVYVGKTIRHTPYVGDTVTLNKAFTTEAAAYAWIAGDSDRDFEELELIPDAQGGTDAK